MRNVDEQTPTVMWLDDFTFSTNFNKTSSMSCISTSMVCFFIDCQWIINYPSWTEIQLLLK